MGNFDFLIKQDQYKDFAHACVEAEDAMALSTVMTSMMTRRALELAIKWVYKVDVDLEIPYRDNLSSLVHGDDFMEIIDKDLFYGLKFIITNGNSANHTAGKVEKSTAMTGLMNLFEFVQWIDYCYGVDYEDRLFDEDKVPSSDFIRLNEKPENKEAILLSTSNEDDKPIEEQRKEMDAADQEEFTEKRKAAEAVHGSVFKVSPRTEAATRKEFIDVDLALAGWVQGVNVDVEVPVKGMPNASGSGAVDYVLYGRDGLPLAVVEAKRDSRDTLAGSHQAVLYQECLEKETGQRPFVYVTNGFVTVFTDDISTRYVSGFHSQEDLQLKVDRRSLQRPLENMDINEDIAGRPYQIQAIRNVLESFSKNKRKALLVMATGTGKTRVSASIVDVMTRANWAKNILFLADRNALLTQAMRSYDQLLPDLTMANLNERFRKKDNDPRTSRIVFSTYPTMMNAIDAVRTEDERFFTIGHFDLIVVDEAHRSIYKKYQAIFDYFDANILGLTATPREDINKNTYDIFDLENGVPTFAYELEDGVRDGYILDYRTIEAKLKLPSEGIHYDDLSDEDKEHFDEVFGEDPEIKDIDGSAINSWLFNQSTVDLVLRHLMEEGIKDSSGNEIGKTIIFAKNQRHAKLIKERFDKLFPEKGTEYAKIITYEVDQAQDLIDRFSVKERLPNIAISVNMLDTGIDVPEIVNLVFFKKVRSKTMFWQMIGRGVRLCEDLFGPGRDKEGFLIFDYGDNFEFFRANPKASSETVNLSLTERIFKIKVELISTLQDAPYKYSNDYIEFKDYLIDSCLGQLERLDQASFLVRQKLEYVTYYKERDNWYPIKDKDKTDLETHIGPILYASEDHELTQRFDLYMISLELSILQGNKNNTMIKNVADLANRLAEKTNVPQVKEKLDTLRKIQTNEFWQDADVFTVDEIREDLRDLMKLVDKVDGAFFYTNFDDEILEVNESDAFYDAVDLSNYKDKVEHYIRTNTDNSVIDKIYNNEKIDRSDLEDLEKVLWKDLGSEEDYKVYYGDKAIGLLVRQINGLSYEAVNEAFSAFLSSYQLNSKQMEFVKIIMEYIERNGYMEMTQFQKEPFKNIGNISVIFSDDKNKVREIVEVINTINGNVSAA